MDMPAQRHALGIVHGLGDAISLDQLLAGRANGQSLK
jgi:hypothetical protein